MTDEQLEREQIQRLNEWRDQTCSMKEFLKYWLGGSTLN